MLIESQARTKRKREGDDDDDSDMTSRDASTITESSAPVRQRSTRSAIIKDVNNTASSSTVGDLVAAEESIAAFDCPVQGCGKTYTLVIHDKYYYFYLFSPYLTMACSYVSLCVCSARIF